MSARITYSLYETFAPASLDLAGSVSLADTVTRYVLIDDRHVVAQMQRYWLAGYIAALSQPSQPSSTPTLRK